MTNAKDNARSEIAQAVAKALAFRNCGKSEQARIWARIASELILSECAC